MNFLYKKKIVFFFLIIFAPHWKMSSDAHWKHDNDVDDSHTGLMIGLELYKKMRKHLNALTVAVH